jgi:uncharacterized protein YdbL (DUF1318 family)
MFRFAYLKVVAVALALSACVTINVYFPAAAVEQAADRLIEDVMGSPSARKKTSAVDEQGAWRWQPRVKQVVYATVGSLLDLVVPKAHAQADLNVSTPAIRQLTESMKERHARLVPYYDSGAIGFTQDGLIEVRDQNAIPLPERNTVRKLVAEENADRANLYREFAVANGHPEWEPDIRKVFAGRWIEKASPGWYYQDASGAWKRK